MLLFVELVENFHQFVFLTIRQFHDISFGEFFGIVAYSLINAFGLHSIELSHVRVQNHLLVSQGF